jgi:hypothetical protein
LVLVLAAWDVAIVTVVVGAVSVLALLVRDVAVVSILTPAAAVAVASVVTCSTFMLVESDSFIIPLIFSFRLLQLLDQIVTYFSNAKKRRMWSECGWIRQDKLWRESPPRVMMRGWCAIT